MGKYPLPSITNPSIFIDVDMDMDIDMDYSTLIFHYFRFIKDRATIIIDRMDITSPNKDPLLLRTLASTFGQHYPEHVDKLFMFPRTMLLAVAWNVTRVFLNPGMAGRVSCVFVLL